MKTAVICTIFVFLSIFGFYAYERHFKPAPQNEPGAAPVQTKTPKPAPAPVQTLTPVQTPASVATPAPTLPVQQAKAQLIALAVGDSLTYGTGDEQGKGYAGRAIESFKGARDVQFANVAVPGHRTQQLLEIVSQPANHASIKNSGAILMTIGGNDLFRQGAALQLDLVQIAQWQKEYLQNLDSILGKISALNPNAKIYIAGLYNPFLDQPGAAATSAIVAEWNQKTQELAAKRAQVRFVPTYDIFEKNVPAYLAPDHFHPNGKGYAKMAERLQAAMAKDFPN